MYVSGEPKGEAKARACRFEMQGMKMPESLMYDPKPL